MFTQNNSRSKISFLDLILLFPCIYIYPIIIIIKNRKMLEILYATTIYILTTIKPRLLRFFNINFNI